MAKLENSAVKKLKGKKRKHTNTETEDEIANKSVIVDANVGAEEPMQTNMKTGLCMKTNIKQSKKRKNNEKQQVREKRCKLEGIVDTTPLTKIDGSDDDFHEPTLDELKECEKPENTLAIVTGRQKKKQKHQKLLKEQKGQSVTKEKQRNAEYLIKWKHARDSWKFEKLRQISIQQTMFESEKLEEDLWPVALEYLAGTKGSAKDKIVKLAKDVIEEIDKLCDQQETDEKKQNIINSIKYQRARSLLQLFY